jgi:hypothetical protein
VRFLPAIALILLLYGCRKDNVPVTLISNADRPYVRGYINDVYVSSEAQDLYSTAYYEGSSYYDQGVDHAVLGYYFTVDLENLIFRLNFYHLDSLVYLGEPLLQREYYFNKDFGSMEDILGEGDWTVMPDTFLQSQTFESYGLERGVSLFYWNYPKSIILWHVVPDTGWTENPNKVTILDSRISEIQLANEEWGQRSDTVLFIQGSFDCRFCSDESTDTVTMRGMEFGFLYHRLPQDNYQFE